MERFFFPFLLHWNYISRYLYSCFVTMSILKHARFTNKETNQMKRLDSPMIQYSSVQMNTEASSDTTTFENSRRHKGGNHQSYHQDSSRTRNAARISLYVCARWPDRRYVDSTTTHLKHNHTSWYNVKVHTLISIIIT